MKVAVVILTFNEAPNIARTLSRVSWASDIVVVDSQSTDGTRDIAASHPGVRVFQRAFTTHAEQWNFAIAETGITADWVLALDADFVLSDAVAAEIQALQPNTSIAGYWASFDYCIDGTALRGAAYPPVIVLYQRSRARYHQDGHTQRVQIDGAVASLSGRILHDDRKPLAQWLAAQSRYMGLEADKLTRTPSSQLSAIDKVRQTLIVMPPAMFLYCYFVRGGLLDGRKGLFYALQRSVAEAILSIYLLDRRLFGKR